MFHPIAQKYPVDEFVPNLVYADVSNGAKFFVNQFRDIDIVGG